MIKMRVRDILLPRISARGSRGSHPHHHTCLCDADEAVVEGDSLIKQKTTMTIDPREQGHEFSGGDLSPEEMRRKRLEALEGSKSPLYGQTAAAPASSLLVDEDEDLQAAIALSLHETSGGGRAQTTRQETGVNTSEEKEVDMEDAKTSGSDGRPLDLSIFHSVMWDNVTTTENDKIRWIQQGIDLRDKMEIDAAPPSESDSLLTTIGSDHGPWGLTQHHGGPCGVLAAVQAELLRLLLFAKRNPLEYPTEIDPDQTVSPMNLHVITEELVREALAMSIAIIVARATLMPPAVDEDADIAVSDKKCAKIVIPSSTSEDPYSGLTWDHLYPPVQNESTSLKVYSISAPSNPSKRQKMDESQASTDWLIPREMRITQLAHAISKFLLHAPPGQDAPLESFRKPGGVLLLTMSLVCSRGTETIQSDMDDSIGKLTSQFGHCSQGMCMWRLIKICRRELLTFLLTLSTRTHQHVADWPSCIQCL